MTYFEIVSVVSSVIALFLSLASLVHARTIKELDLRLELAKSINNLDAILSEIDSYLDFVHQSHARVLAATGQLGSGAMESFEKEFSNDKAKLQELLKIQPLRKDNYRGSSQIELEKNIVEVHAFHKHIEKLRTKYQEVYSSDEDRRKEIRIKHQ